VTGLLRMLGPPCAHPVAQGALVDPEILRTVHDRPTRTDHQLDRVRLKLGRVLLSFRHARQFLLTAVSTNHTAAQIHSTQGRSTTTEPPMHTPNPTNWRCCPACARRYAMQIDLNCPICGGAGLIALGTKPAHRDPSK